MPPDPPEPADLHARFNDLDWGDHLPSAAEIAKIHGTKATVKSLRMLEQAVNAEPRITADFLAALPPNCSPYKLTSRVKSPQSLARKLHDGDAKKKSLPIDDLFRYTVLTESPAELVEAARSTVENLGQSDWQVRYAMHSYTEGSRYKGLHVYLLTPRRERVEVQCHSKESAKVKEATTKWYEIERSEHATPDARIEARQNCIELSAPLTKPYGIAKLHELGGKPVAIHNYSDSREQEQPGGAVAEDSGPHARTHAQHEMRNNEVSR
jgi:hypothetical protein